MYTHTFEIIINGMNVEGEMHFGDGGVPKVKFNNPFEMTMHELNHLVELLTVFNRTCAECGEITKIEIVKK
jgi:hypothetical protein